MNHDWNLDRKTGLDDLGNNGFDDPGANMEITT